MKKTIIGLFAALFFVSIAGCKINVGNGGGSGGEGNNSTNIVTFGTFPQSLKADGIDVNETDSKTVGSFTYYKGSDGEWYAKLESKYYKVEPIKWRVLTTNYDHDGNASTPGKKLLLAENILINCMYYDYSNVNSNGNRTIGTATIYPNNYEHSRVRAYLNGLSYQVKAGDSETQEADESLVNKGFFQTAFTTQEQDAIATTTVVNNARSTNQDSNDKEWNNGANQYASDTPTSDKIFLLSEQEATKADYGFAAYDASGTGNTRIRMPTAFAKANGVFQNTTAGYGGGWWLRSPLYNNSSNSLLVVSSGHAHFTSSVRKDDGGVVPALCLN